MPAVCSDATDVARHFPPRSFDLVTAFHLIEHLPDLQGLLRSVRTLLKPGGWFAGTVPLVDSLQVRRFGARWAGASEAPRHVTIPSREGIDRLFETAGFERPSIRPDSLLNCAGVAVLSALPRIGSRHATDNRWWLKLSAPAIGLVTARKPL